MSQTPVQFLLRVPALGAIGLVRLYQRFLSPLLPPSCRYTPSCSQYMVLSLQHHGFFRGGWLGIRRILRCNPYFRGGFDPPPGLTAAQCGCHEPIAGTQCAAGTHDAPDPRVAASETSP